MTDIHEIISKYTAGKATLAETNQALADAGAPFSLEPGKHTITDAERKAAKTGAAPSDASGWGLLDTGTGSLMKVHVEKGRLVNSDCGAMPALCIIGGRVYSVHGSVLTAYRP